MSLAWARIQSLRRGVGDLYSMFNTNDLQRAPAPGSGMSLLKARLPNPAGSEIQPMLGERSPKTSLNFIFGIPFQHVYLRWRFGYT